MGIKLFTELVESGAAKQILKYSKNREIYAAAKIEHQEHTELP